METMMSRDEAFALASLRRKGWAVAVIPPQELMGHDKWDVEDAMWLEGVKMVEGE